MAISCNKCNNEQRTVKVEIPKDDSVQVKIHRYEKALFAVSVKDLKNGLKKLLPEYSFFIPDSALNDSLSLLQMKSFLTDRLIITLFDDCIKKYPDVKDLESAFSKAFSYYRHYYPEKKIPEVYTCVSGLYYEEPVRFDDSVLIISLDMYMGTNYKYYKEMLAGVPLYMQKRFRKESVLPDCMRKIAKQTIDNSKGNNRFIDRIIYEGKIQYFIDAMLPDTPDSIKIYYSPAQMEWCVKNEEKVWSYIIENKLLYSTDVSMTAKFCSEGPFTAVFSKQSPPRVGNWIGWQIVRSFMENNKKVTLKELFGNQDSQAILTKSKYKPKK